VRPVVKVES